MPIRRVYTFPPRRAGTCSLVAEIRDAAGAEALLPTIRPWPRWARVACVLACVAGVAWALGVIG